MSDFISCRVPVSYSLRNCRIHIYSRSCLPASKRECYFIYFCYGLALFIFFWVFFVLGFVCVFFSFWWVSERRGADGLDCRVNMKEHISCHVFITPKAKIIVPDWMRVIRRCNLNSLPTHFRPTYMFTQKNQVGAHTN